MNQLYEISRQADQSQFPNRELANYYQSDAFRERTKFDGPSAEADCLALTHYLLKECALEPEHDFHDDLLKRGTVCLQFFGLTNPIPQFDMEPGSAAHQNLLAAVDANQAGPMADAARRTLKWRSLARAWKRDRSLDAVLTRFRSTLGHLEPIDANTARREKEASLKHVRATRLAKISQAAAPRVTSYYLFVVDMVVKALPAAAPTPPRSVRRPH